MSSSPPPPPPPTLVPTWLWEVRDRRVDSWPLTSSPWPTVAVVAAYVAFSVWLGPVLMRRKKEPFSLYHLVQAYNLLQVCLSAYLVWAAWWAGWGTHYSWGNYPKFHKIVVVAVASSVCFLYCCRHCRCCYVTFAVTDCCVAVFVFVGY